MNESQVPSIVAPGTSLSDEAVPTAHVSYNKDLGWITSPLISMMNADYIVKTAGREELSKRFKDPDDPFKVVIVRDMWLSGFDVPSLHTMYIDKPMRGHGLMQAIARVMLL